MPIDEIFYSIVFDADDADLDRVRNSLDGIDKRIQAIGRQLAIAGAAVVGFGGLAVREFASVESTLARINGLVGVSQDQLNAWGADLERIAIDTGTALNQVAESLFFATSAGLRGAAAIDAVDAAARGEAVGLGRSAQ